MALLIGACTIGACWRAVSIPSNSGAVGNGSINRPVPVASEKRPYSNRIAGLASRETTTESYCSVSIPETEREKLAHLEKLISLREQGCHQNLAMINLLVAVTARNYPEDVLNFLLEPRSQPLWKMCIPTLLNVWVASDPMVVVGKVMSFKSGQLRGELENRLLCAFCEQAPKEALAILKHTEKGVIDMNNFGTLSPYSVAFLNLSSRSPEDAIQMLNEVSGMEKEFALVALATAFGRGEEALQRVLDRCSNLPADRKAIMQVQDVILSERLRKDGQSVLDALSTMALSGQDRVALDFCMRHFRSLSKFNTPKTLDFLTLCAARGQEISEKYVALIQTQLDTAESTRWLLRGGAEVSNSKIRKPIIEKICNEDPEGTASSILTSSGNEETLKEIVVEWSRRDPVKALEWLNSNVKPGSPYSTVRFSVEILEANSNADRFVQQVASSVDSPNNRKLARIVADRISTKSAIAASEWAQRIEDDAIQLEVIDVISRNWLLQDSSKASEWIKRMPQGAARNLAIANLVNAIKDIDPNAAFQWEKEIQVLK